MLNQPPPRATRAVPVFAPRGFIAVAAEYRSYQSAVHSHTFPAMSSAPNGLALAGKLPTGAVVSQPSLALYIATQSRFRTRFAMATHSVPQAFRRVALGSSLPHG